MQVGNLLFNQNFWLFLENFGPEKQNKSTTKYIMNTNNETIEDLSGLEQYLKDYDNKNSFSFTGNFNKFKCIF